jgi:Protein of unknown function (DUF3105)
MTNARKSREATAEKAARLRLEQEARDRRRKMGLIATSVVVILALAAGITLFIVHANKPSTSAKAAIPGVQTYTGLTRNHVTTKVTYKQTPPVGGDHNPNWLNCGIYTSPVPNENAVHDLEHGAVWVTYQPNLAAADVAKLTALVKGQTYLDLSPYPGLPTPVVASAWGIQLKLQSASDPRLALFIKKYKQGPQTPEPGATCTGGVGTPNG